MENQSETNIEAAAQTVDVPESSNDNDIVGAHESVEEQDLPSPRESETTETPPTDNSENQIADSEEVAVTETVTPGNNAADEAMETRKDNLPSSRTGHKGEREEARQDKKNKDIIVGLEAAVKREVNARKELEEMLMRLEQHLKAEEESRKNTEHLLDASLQNEMRLKSELEALYHSQKKRDNDIQQQKRQTESERQALEEMRQQIDTEITAAREEAQKAVEDLKTAEERVRAAERVEMSKMETEYQKRVSMLGLELDRVRQELIIRTKLLSEEMERWRQQAEFSAAAVIEAKAEVTERKRDLDATRDKMDKLMDRLHVGREHGLVLQASLTSANAYTAQAQRTLIHSMESSFQQNVQQALPWGGQIGGVHHPTVQEDVTDTMAILNRGMEIANGKGSTAGKAQRMLESNKQTMRSKSTRTARRARP